MGTCAVPGVGSQQIRGRGPEAGRQDGKLRELAANRKGSRMRASETDGTLETPHLPDHNIIVGHRHFMLHHPVDEDLPDMGRPVGAGVDNHNLQNERRGGGMRTETRQGQ